MDFADAFNKVSKISETSMPDLRVTIAQKTSSVTDAGKSLSALKLLPLGEGEHNEQLIWPRFTPVYVEYKSMKTTLKILSPQFVVHLMGVNHHG